MTGALPHRTETVRTAATTNTSTSHDSDDEAIPDSDLGDTTTILVERLRAWKHMCGYLEDYVNATQKVQKAQAKEFEKILKTVSDPLKEGHHFVQGQGGITALFDSLRLNTQGISDVHLETEKNLKSTVCPILEQLHNEVKAKSKELQSGASKAQKLVTKARANTQKHIELLGQHTAVFDSGSKSKNDAVHDPYVLSRGVNYRLNRQINEENNNLNELLQIQNSFQQFEAHIVETVQNALNRFFQCMGSQSDRQRAMYADMVSTGQQVPTNFEWANFFERNSASLIDPNTPKRSLSNITYPNQSHASTKALVEGTIQRKSRALMKGYTEGYYVVSPAGFLHGFKENDDLKQDPQPDLSLYLPDCTIGSFDNLKFTIKGKDVSGGKVGNAFHMSSEFQFKVNSKNQLDEWAQAVTSFSHPVGGSQPTSPIAGQRTSSMGSKAPVAAAGAAGAAGVAAGAGAAESGVTGETKDAPAVTQSPTDMKTAAAGQEPSTAAPMAAPAAAATAAPTAAPTNPATAPTTTAPPATTAAPTGPTTGSPMAAAPEAVPVSHTAAPTGAPAPTADPTAAYGGPVAPSAAPVTHTGAPSGAPTADPTSAPVYGGPPVAPTAAPVTHTGAPTGAPAPEHISFAGSGAPGAPAAAPMGNTFAPPADSSALPAYGAPAAQAPAPGSTPFTHPAHSAAAPTAAPTSIQDPAYAAANAAVNSSGTQKIG